MRARRFRSPAAERALARRAPPRAGTRVSGCRAPGRQALHNEDPSCIFIVQQINRPGGPRVGVRGWAWGADLGMVCVGVGEGGNLSPRSPETTCQVEPKLSEPLGREGTVTRDDPAPAKTAGRGRLGHKFREVLRSHYSQYGEASRTRADSLRKRADNSRVWILKEGTQDHGDGCSMA